MKKNAYLEQKDVRSFVSWMAKHLGTDSALQHGYVRPRKLPLKFRNLADALAQYEWPFRYKGLDGEHRGKTFEDSAAVLSRLQQRLKAAVTTADSNYGDDAACQTAIDVVRWGGVSARNVDWLLDNKKGLAQVLMDVSSKLQQADDEVQLPAELRFNAGMTKVYSLLIDRFIIYDSRVAAALAWFVVEWARGEGRNELPESLAFQCMSAKESPSAVRRKLRNPSAGNLIFKPLNNNARDHVVWNLRASWILQEVLDTSPLTPFGTGPAASRKLEAALFMWGYDLTPPLAA